MKNKMKNIHVLPTDEPSRLYLGNNGNFVFGMIQTSIQSINDDFTNQNIYITSDEEIENCWFVNLTNNEIGYIKNNIGTQKNAKKIILTTDQKLNGVQKIDDEFLEWFVKNPSCEEIGVKKYENNKYWTYEKIIPKEEPKQSTKDRIMSETSEETKQKARDYANSLVIKQETLEESAEIFVNNRFAKQICGDETYPDIYASKSSIVESHILFAKWQQENSCEHNYILTAEQGHRIIKCINCNNIQPI